MKHIMGRAAFAGAAGFFAISAHALTTASATAPQATQAATAARPAPSAAPAPAIARAPAPADNLQMLVRVRFMSVAISSASNVKDMTKAAFARIPGSEINQDSIPYIGWAPAEAAVSEEPVRAFDYYGAHTQWGSETRFLSQGSQVWGSVSFPVGAVQDSGVWLAPHRRFDFSLVASPVGAWDGVKAQWKVEDETGGMDANQAVATWKSFKGAAAPTSQALMIGYPNSRGMDWVILTTVVGRRQ